MSKIIENYKNMSGIGTH